MHGARRRARAYALQVLFAIDANRDFDARGAVDRYGPLFDLDIDPGSVEFAAQIVEEAVAHWDEIDDIIQSASRNWRIERMSQVDRNILRLASAELRRATDVPVNVIINEAVELAKEFGAEESASFVNGILDRIAHQVRGG